MTDPIATSLFGKTRRKVLALLFGKPDESFYLRQVVRETGAGVGAVQRELMGLTSAGLISRTPRGKQVYFQADRSSPVFAEIKSLMEKTTGLAYVIRLALAKLEESGLVSFAFLFGSVATGTHGPSSDVDLMVIGDAKLSDLVPVVRDAQDRVGREINPTVYPRSEFQERLKAGEHFVSRVLERPKVMLIGTEDELEELAGESLAG